MRILLADDHTVVRHGLKQILAESFSTGQAPPQGGTPVSPLQAWTPTPETILGEVRKKSLIGEIPDSGEPFRSLILMP